MNDVEEDYLQNTQRLMLNVGRMGPEEKRRRRQIQAERINTENIQDMIRKDNSNPGKYLVQSFSNIELQYKITVVENNMQSCTCGDFIHNRIACKHGYLLHRYNGQYSPIRTRFMDISLNVVTLNVLDEQQQSSNDASDVESVPRSQNNLTNKMVKLLVAYGSYTENPHLLSEKQLALVREGVTKILSAITNDSNSNSNRGTNRNYSTPHG
ncbi:MAG: hypothetical protein EXX96DRAFT_389291 [Benjaminiella poitrasii]|nr:MAG: hypothetical protein EXX96DRAFT_389291 [Benjaminiella poitrasii]